MLVNSGQEGCKIDEIKCASGPLYQRLYTIEMYMFEMDMTIPSLMSLCMSPFAFYRAAANHIERRKRRSGMATTASDCL
ncbi:hypothetical protein QQG55_47355 [Brugia pahangi]|uniref:Uncharacterized protein n=1 Tax=Brugia pahangi TaxID=6280 RepID=A0A0N4SWL3_BRUPA|nr:unnamed protein product [Brugia pahangi]